MSGNATTAKETISLLLIYYLSASPPKATSSRLGLVLWMTTRGVSQAVKSRDEIQFAVETSYYS